uniref:Uncharacterized protein n=1 Tax=Sesuvium portulacastrum TaxID=221166 RepID=A0A6B9MAQ8_SESPO|nr:hypothetical protein [Sesuvium portulacastrum]
MDLTETLKGMVDYVMYKVEYEDLPSISFSCGRYGHVAEACHTFPMSQTATPAQGSNNENSLSVPSSENSYWANLDLGVIEEWIHGPAEMQEDALAQNQDIQHDQEVDQPHPAIARMEYDSAEYHFVERHESLCGKWEKKIIDRVRQLLPNHGILVQDPDDIRRALDMFFFDSQQKEYAPRLSYLRSTFYALNNPQNQKWRTIINEIENLINPHPLGKSKNLILNTSLAFVSAPEERKERVSG